MDKRRLLEAIAFYHNLGFELIPMEIYFDNSKNKILKKPATKWSNKDAFSLTDISEFISKNKRVNGVAAKNGINNLHVFDLDKCTDEKFFQSVLRELELDENYPWSVKTGNGFHIWYYGETLKQSENFYSNNSGVQAYTLIDKMIQCKQVEIRENACLTVLPYSQYLNENFYCFRNNPDGFPKSKPSIVKQDSINLLIKNYFEKKRQSTEAIKRDESALILIKGVDKGQRHISLPKVFGYYFHINPEKLFIQHHLESWNATNTPPLELNELQAQFSYLWLKYSKGLDGIFHNFPACLLALPDKPEVKLKKILCFSIKEYNGEDRLIEQLDLSEQLNVYHNECMQFYMNYENSTGRKSQIIRVGEQLIFSVIKGSFDYLLFSIFCGIISYLGRGEKPAKKISNDIIAYRSCGFKNFKEYFESNSQVTLPSKYKVRKSVLKLEELNFIRTFKLRASEMTHYSTKFHSKEKLKDYVVKGKTKKLDKKMEEEKLRQTAIDEISKAQEEYNLLKNITKQKEKRIFASSSSPLILCKM